MGSKENKFITGNELKEMERNYNRTWWCNDGKIESKEIILELCNWASTYLSNIHYSCGLVWFGSVAEMQTANRTEPCGSVQKSSEFIRTKCGFLRFRFGLVWFAVFLLGWFGFEHPYYHLWYIIWPKHMNGSSKYCLRLWEKIIS